MNNQNCDNFNSYFKQLTFKLLVTFSQGTSTKFSLELQNLKNFNWEQMGAALIVWQQLNILLNPLCHFDTKYNYNQNSKNNPIAPIKKPEKSELDKIRVEFGKSYKSRKANDDMSVKKLMLVRVEKVFNTFKQNKEHLFINGEKRYFDKTRDTTQISQDKYNKCHDILLAAVKTIEKN